MCENSKAFFFIFESKNCNKKYEKFEIEENKKIVSKILIKMLGHLISQIS